MSKIGRNFSIKANQFWALSVFLIIVFLIGGGARDDIQSLIILRPLAVLFCGIGIWTLKREHIRSHSTLFMFAGSIFLVVILHLIPLPPAIWSNLPGREIVTEIDALVALEGVFRPIAMTPIRAWNAFYSLFIPLAVLLLGVQLNGDERYKLLTLLLGIGLFSGLLGLFQSISSPTGPLYLYEITNNGSAVGLFSNRNHQATLVACLFPMLAVYASTGYRSHERAKLRQGIAIAATVVLIPLLLVTGSRAGLLLGVLGLISIGILYSKPDEAITKKRILKTFDLRWLLGLFAIFLLGSLTIIMSRAEALQRLLRPDQVEGLRFQVWGPIIEMGWKYFPFGSGVGSFVEVFQIDEPDRLLRPQYLNHAHNDWLEVFVTTGLPGLAIMLAVIAAFARASYVALRQPIKSRSVKLARLGSVIILIFALASLVDYPVRVPSISCLVVICAIWLTPASSVRREG